MDESDEGLVRFLMRDQHGTPFEHNSFRFHIRAPIFVTREWMRHRVGSFNEFSMRYAKATEDFYVPEADDVRSQVGKPGAYSFEPVDPELAETAREALQDVYEQAYGTYERLVEAGVARELARSVIPVGAYTEFFWTVNATGAHELRLPPCGRDRAAGDPPLRRGLRALPRRANAGHARRVREERPRRSLDLPGASGSVDRRAQEPGRILLGGVVGPHGRHDPLVVLGEPVGGVHPYRGPVVVRPERPARSLVLTVLGEPEDVVAARRELGQPDRLELERPVAVLVGLAEPDERRGAGALSVASMRIACASNRPKSSRARRPARPTEPRAPRRGRRPKRSGAGSRWRSASPPEPLGSGSRGPPVAAAGTRSSPSTRASFSSSLSSTSSPTRIADVALVAHSRTSSRSPERRARPARVRVFTVPSGTSR